MNQPALSAFLWSIADLLRGDYKQSDYGKVILPFTNLPRRSKSGSTADTIDLDPSFADSESVLTPRHLLNIAPSDIIIFRHLSTDKA